MALWTPQWILDTKITLILAWLKGLRSSKEFFKMADFLTQSSVGSKQTQCSIVTSGDESLKLVPEMGPDGFFSLLLHLALLQFSVSFKSNLVAFLGRNQGISSF